MSNKSSKEQVSLSPRILNNNVGLLSPNSLSTYSSIDKKVFGDSKVHKSLKQKNFGVAIKIEQKIQKSDVGKKGKTYNSHGGNRQKKFSESYYCRTKGSIGQDQKTIIKQKDQQVQLKFKNHQLTNSKSSKSKLCISRRVQKIKTESNNPENRSFSNRHSLHRLISVNSNSGNVSKIRTLHTLSPDADPTLEQLSYKRKGKNLGKDQTQILKRMSKILIEYQQIVAREEKQKDSLMKENKKLKQKLQAINQTKRYRKVDEYNN